MKRHELTIKTDTNSTQDWRGLTSAKFGHPQRVHFSPRDMLKGTIEGLDDPVRGRRYFEPKYGTPMQERKYVRTFPNLHNKESDMTDLTSLQKLAYVPHQKKIIEIKNGSMSTKRSWNKSLVMPASFNGIKHMRETSGWNTPKETLPTIKTRRAHNTMNWKEKERLRESLNEIYSVRDLNKWETRTLGNLGPRWIEPANEESPTVEARLQTYGYN